MSLLLKQIALPLRIRTDAPMTDAAFAQFCAVNEPNRFEREANGEIIVMSPNFSEGGGIELDVAGEFRNWSVANGVGRAFGPNSGFTLPDGSVRAADISWIRWNRWSRLSQDQRHRSFARISPDFVIEVRSETDRLSAAQEKMSIWIANGVEVAWLIDPQRRVVEVYRPGQQPEVYGNPSSVQGTGCVAGFELVMEKIWGSVTL